MSSGLYNTHKIDFDTTLDLTRLKPYGDTMNDGKVQTSFTLPIKDDERGEEAARQIAKKMGLEEPNVAYHAPLDRSSPSTWCTAAVSIPSTTRIST